MTIQRDILAWYDLHGRHSLPWKVNNIYKIWISEIMLQQTQVTTAIPYFKAFIKEYPSLKKLCAAKLDDILKLWSGLGYYRRAENIFKTAQIIKSKYNGIFPKQYDLLIDLPGIGRTTASAILTFSKVDNLPILDGNIKRLLSRIYRINSNILNKDIEQKLWKISESLLPKKKASEFNQALMDIGSLICKKSNPMCSSCPVQKNCKSFEKNLFYVPKIKKNNPVKKQKIWAALIINKQKKIYLKKVSWDSLWKGLYSSPIFPSENEMHLWLKEKNIKGEFYTKSQKFIHKLSHIDFSFSVRLFEVKSNKKLILIDDNWYNLSNVEHGIPKFQEKILNFFKEYL